MSPRPKEARLYIFISLGEIVVFRLPNSAAFVAVLRSLEPRQIITCQERPLGGLPANRRSEMDYEASNTAIRLVSHNSTAALLTISLPPVLGGVRGHPNSTATLLLRTYSPLAPSYVSTCSHQRSKCCTIKRTGATWTRMMQVTLLRFELDSLALIRDANMI
jgi:hypothetical protein